LDRRTTGESKAGGAELRCQLKEAPYCCDLAQLEQLDLTDYVRSTAAFSDLPPAERLRLLAVAAESEASAATQPRGWLALERVYRAAIELEPSNRVLLASRVISAVACASSVEPGESATRILDAAVAYARQGVADWPDDAEIRDILGYASYHHPRHSAAEALSVFDEALLLDPKLQHPRLYRAHCLHDMSSWSEAAVAYAAVDPTYFVEHRAWRYDLLREQRAWCLLKSGDAVSALDETRRLLDRYERDPRLVRYQPLPHLKQLVDSEPTGALRVRLQRLLDLDSTEQ
jgi:hypothetical protein